MFLFLTIKLTINGQKFIYMIRAFYNTSKIIKHKIEKVVSESPDLLSSLVRATVSTVLVSSCVVGARKAGRSCSSESDAISEFVASSSATKVVSKIMSGEAVVPEARFCRIEFVSSASVSVRG